MSDAAAANQNKSALIHIGDWFFKYRDVTFTLVMAALFIVFPPRPLAGDPALDAWMDGFGVLVIAAGSAVRGWVIGLVYIKRGGVDKKVSAETLVTTGMFLVCRNPLYIGNALVLAGLFIVVNNAWVYVLGALFFGFSYAAIVAAEEHFLRAKFGSEFDAYCRRVRRFWPDFSIYREATSDLTFNWRRVVIKDYSSIYAWVATVIALIAYERTLWRGGELSLEALWPPALAVAAATAAMVAVRVLKKRGVLSERGGRAR